MRDIVVDEVTIPARAIAAEAQHHPSDSPRTAWESAARALAIRELLLQEARRQGLDPAPSRDAQGRLETEEEAMIGRLLDTAVAVPEPDPESCRRYYDNNRGRFRSPDLYEPAHILLSVSPTDHDAYDRATERAAALIAALRDAPETFDTLARTHSDCPSAGQGGRLGQITRGQTVAEFETFLVALEPGQLCPIPVKTRYGVHIVRLDHRILGTLVPFEAVHDRIAGYLRESVWRRATSQYVKLLAGRTRVAGIDLEGTASPLVQ